MVKPNALSTTARTLLSIAAARDDRLALAPERLPTAARRAVVQSLLKTGLLIEIAAHDDQPASCTLTWHSIRSTRRAMPAMGR